MFELSDLLIGKYEDLHTKDKYENYVAMLLKAFYTNLPKRVNTYS